MEQKNVLNLIINEIYQLENYVQGWRDQENIPSIEKDLVQRKLQQIYDQVKMLNASIQQDTDQSTALTEMVVSHIKQPEITVPGPVKEITFEKTTEIIEETKPLINEIPLKKEPVQTKEVILPKPVIEPETIIQTQEIIVEKTKETPKELIITEKFSHTQKLVNETVKTRTVMDVSSKIKTSPISSIQSAINLNDKFLFIRELFKNNNLLYNQTIERLNNASGYNAAMAIIEQEFAWDMKDPQVLKLVDLIKRKHNA